MLPWKPTRRFLEGFLEGVLPELLGGEEVLRRGSQMGAFRRRLEGRHALCPLTP